jgi:hypothetical protein
VTAATRAKATKAASQVVGGRRPGWNVTISLSAPMLSIIEAIEHRACGSPTWRALTAKPASLCLPFPVILMICQATTPSTM